MKRQDWENAFPKVSKTFHSGVADALNGLPEQEELQMKRNFSVKKAVAVSIAAVMVLGAGVFAASGIVSLHRSWSHSWADYKTMPTEQQLVTDLGYAPILPDSFANGYAFQGATIVHNDLEDDGGNSVERYKSLSVDYEKARDKVTLSAEKRATPMEESQTPLTQVDGVDVYYTAYTNKLVPPDYELTQQDQLDEANGDIVFSYGSDQVEVHQVQSIRWTVGDIQYSLLAVDSALTPDELTDMAADVIGQ